MKQLGRYEITRQIGRGGMGDVFEAQDMLLGRRVAIKTLNLASVDDPAAVRERFHREARLGAALRHRNIVSIFDVGEQDLISFIVMEYVDGRTLQSLLADADPSEWTSFMAVLAPCAEALDFAHGRGVVHGDIKPGNIMVDAEGVPKILDFGLARLAHQTSGTNPGMLVGTPQYLPPELCKGEVSVPASDQYSLAVIAYRLATGEFPFSGDTLMKTILNVLSQTPAPPDHLNPRIPDRAARAIERALAKDPAARFPTCVQFLQEVSDLSPGPPAGASLPAGISYDAGRETVGIDPQEITAALPITLPASPPPPPPPGALAPPAAAAPGLLARLRGMLARTRPDAEVPSAEPRERTQAIPVVRERIPETGPDEDEGQSVLLKRPAHSRLAPEELARRQADELVRCARENAFRDALVLQGEWMPGVETASPALLGFREAARYLMAARDASNSHNAVEHLTRAEAVLVSVGASLLRARSPESESFPKALEVWKGITRARLTEARERMAAELPNPFRAGQPLRPDHGRPVFRGRDEIVRQIESILVTRESGSIALLGPRRCGKTSLLQMLPSLIPDGVCIFFDLQDNPVDSPRAFFEALDRQAREQAWRDRRLKLPALKTGGTFSSANEWFLALDRIEGDVRILLCLDEFERLEDLFPGDHQDLLQLMGLFRATIQHRNKLRLLVSGVAPFEELGQIWNDHFINLRRIRVGHLDRPTALALLMSPLPDFPADAVPESVAARIFERTGGQPYLLQLYGSLLIGRLNAGRLRQSTLDEVAKVEEEAIEQGAYYFRHTYEVAPPDARRVLEELAYARRPVVATTTRRWLISRGLLTDEGTLAIPVLGRVIQDELESR